MIRPLIALLNTRQPIVAFMFTDSGHLRTTLVVTPGRTAGQRPRHPPWRVPARRRPTPRRGVGRRRSSSSCYTLATSRNSAPSIPIARLRSPGNNHPSKRKGLRRPKSGRNPLGQRRRLCRPSSGRPSVGPSPRSRSTLSWASGRYGAKINLSRGLSCGLGWSICALM